ncbi:MAG: hypothetical protein WD425_01820 [Nitrospirales bacterium]
MPRILLKGPGILVVGSLVSKPLARSVLVVNVVATPVFWQPAQAGLLFLKAGVSIVTVVAYDFPDPHRIDQTRGFSIGEEASYPVAWEQFCAHVIWGACSECADPVKRVWSKPGVGCQSIGADFHLISVA